MTMAGFRRSKARASDAASVPSTSPWLSAACSPPAAAAARTRSEPSWPVAPRIATSLEDDIALDDALQRVVPLDQALVPLDRPRRGAVRQRALAQGREDLASAGFRSLARRIADAVGDLLEAHPIGAVVGVAVPVLHVGEPERLAQPLRERPDLEVLVVRANVEDLPIDLGRLGLEHRNEGATRVADMHHRAPLRAVAQDLYAPVLVQGEGHAVDGEVESHAP